MRLAQDLDHAETLADSPFSARHSMMYLPSFMIVLQIYAFANLHDLAWGTKGDTTVKDLGGTKKTKTADGKEVLEVAVPTKDEDIDELWQHMKQDIATPQTKTKSKRSADQKQADHFANIVR